MGVGHDAPADHVPLSILYVRCHDVVYAGLEHDDEVPKVRKLGIRSLDHGQVLCILRADDNSLNELCDASLGG